ncbi:hypothetical protein TYRP_011064 [Tyrophagus putrescentiae]|nr:hypothetical protein TYRP_011064 [Tyrophagus putrescentiae]
MAIEKYPTESILRMLATLEPTIEALLKSNTPMSPIVKEKIEQMEKIVSFIPLDEEAIAASWHSKLANWWVEFATQQIPYLVLDPSKEELEMITPPPSPLFGVRRRKDPVAMIQDAVNKSALISSSHNVSVSISSEKNFDLSSNLTASASKKGYLSPPAMKDYCFAVPENPKALPPSSSNDQPATVSKSESNSFQQVGETTAKTFQRFLMEMPRQVPHQTLIPVQLLSYWNANQPSSKFRIVQRKLQLILPLKNICPPAHLKLLQLFLKLLMLALSTASLLQLLPKTAIP